MNVLGLKIIAHDTGAAVISNGRVLAIAEERLNKVKHSYNMFPELSISYCLKGFNLKPEDIDLIVIDQVDIPRRKLLMKDVFLKKMGNVFSKARIEVINHHDAHAASAFFCSPFEEAAILIYDGAGEQFESFLGVTAIETDTIYHGRGNRFYQLQKTMHFHDGEVFPHTFGIGKLYSTISAKYLDFGRYNEGKMMGLAPYGKDSILKRFPPELWYCEKEGHILCNARIRYSKARLRAWAKKNKFLMPLRWLKEIIYQKIKMDFSKSEAGVFAPINLPRPWRVSSTDKLPDDYYTDVAYAAQKILEQVAMKWAKKLKDITDSKNLCVAGGVGLNIDVNKKFIDDAGFEGLFVQPASSDTGVALGCALYGWHVLLDQPRFWIMKHAYLGSSYTEEEILSVIEKRKEDIRVRKSPDIAAETAKLIAENLIVGWFQGASEYGPRALGHRSILCSASRAEMKDILNNKVKHRESWRPFAVSILLEHVPEWLDLNIESPYMLLAAQVKEDKKRLIPSVVHVDGTTRVQSVTSKENGIYYDLISEYHKLTGIPLVLNTSFNLAGEPIIETPGDALDCFLRTKMDYLVIGNYLISKK